MNKDIEKLKTICCKAEYKRIGRANYICAKCKKDVSLELIFLMDIINEQEEL